MFNYTSLVNKIVHKSKQHVADMTYVLCIEEFSFEIVTLNLTCHPEMAAINSNTLYFSHDLPSYRTSRSL
jgi:hypothetical protein